MLGSAYLPPWKQVNFDRQQRAKKIKHGNEEMGGVGGVRVRGGVLGPWLGGCFLLGVSPDRGEEGV